MKEQDCEIKTMSEVFEEINKANNEVVFTKEEAQELLDIMVEDECHWKLRRFFPKAISTELVEAPIQGYQNTSDTTTPPELNAETIANLIEEIYKYIVKDWRYNAVTLQVCRKAKFSRQMVADKMVQCMEEMSQEEAEVGKSLGRSLRRVAESGVDITKAVSYEDICKSGVAKPERVAIFLKNREHVDLVIENK